MEPAKPAATMLNSAGAAADMLATAVPAEPPAPAAPMAPIATAQRIEALDVVRGFALIGIFLMNIEFFNRTFATFNEGMPRGLTGADWWASWFVNYFVQGKFWTIFSLLFGMGFAVMMVRAEQAGREFKRVYLRRVLALAVFGALHYIFIWDGDILFTYAVAALILMVTLHGKPKPMLISMAVLAALGAIPEMHKLFAVVAGVAMAGLLALYLRSDKCVRVRGHSVPLFSFLVMLFGVLLSVAALVFWLLPDAPTQPRVPMSVFGPLMLMAGWLSWKYHDPADKRTLRLGVGLYVFIALGMTAAGLLQYVLPDPDAAVPTVAGVSAATPTAPTGASGGAVKAAEHKAANKPDNTADEKPKKTKEERAADRKVEREKRLAEGRADKEEELRAYTTGSYWDAMQLRARHFVDKALGDFGGAALFMCVFLIGVWFVRSGVMDNTGAHLPLFRQLAFYALPIGIGIGLLGSGVAMSHTAGDRTDGWVFTRGLLLLGNLAACLGYVGLVVLMLRSRTALSRIRVLAPLGRMALTNYLLQSVICAVYFHGYALGHWGMPRGQQVLFVVVVYSAQVVFSHWWLSNFRYGPMEWFWRGFTYRVSPPFKL